MDCPKCHGRFEHINTPAGVVERCSTCHGLWFDVMEHKALKDFARALDTVVDISARLVSPMTNCPARTVPGLHGCS